MEQSSLGSLGKASLCDGWVRASSEVQFGHLYYLSVFNLPRTCCVACSPGAEADAHSLLYFILYPEHFSLHPLVIPCSLRLLSILIHFHIPGFRSKQYHFTHHSLGYQSAGVQHHRDIVPLQGTTQKCLRQGPRLRSVGLTSILDNIGERACIHICARGRRWYDENKMEARERNDGRPVDDHKHKPTTHRHGGKGK